MGQQGYLRSAWEEMKGSQAKGALRQAEGKLSQDALERAPAQDRYRNTDRLISSVSDTDLNESCEIGEECYRARFRVCRGHMEVRDGK